MDKFAPGITLFTQIILSFLVEKKYKSLSFHWIYVKSSCRALVSCTLIDKWVSFLAWPIAFYTIHQNFLLKMSASFVIIINNNNNNININSHIFHNVSLFAGIQVINARFPTPIFFFLQNLKHCVTAVTAVLICSWQHKHKTIWTRYITCTVQQAYNQYMKIH